MPSIGASWPANASSSGAFSRPSATAAILLIRSPWRGSSLSPVSKSRLQSRALDQVSTTRRPASSTMLTAVSSRSRSANETVGGLVSNFEAIDVFFSWDGTRGRVARKAANFERLWTNDTPELDVMPLPAAVERELIMLAEQSPRGIAPMRPRDPLPAARPGRFAAPANVEPRPYQSAAIEAWFAAGARGMLSMATGTGKTKTALFAATELFGQQGKPPCLVIVTPYIHLVDQWAREIEAWGLRPTRCYEAGGIVGSPSLGGSRQPASWRVKPDMPHRDHRNCHRAALSPAGGPPPGGRYVHRR